MTGKVLVHFFPSFRGGTINDRSNDSKTKNRVKYRNGMEKRGKTSHIHSGQNGDKDACIAANARSLCLWQQPGSLLNCTFESEFKTELCRLSELGIYTK